MATQVLVAHSGQRLRVDSGQFSSVDDFKDWVALRSNIPAQHIVALTSQGRAVRINCLGTEAKLFVYDLRTLQGKAAAASEVAIPRSITIPPAPDSIEQVRSISAWHALFGERREWALARAKDAARMATETRERYLELDTMLGCLDVATVNVEISIKGVEPRYEDLKKWLDPALAENKVLAESVEEYLAVARSVQVSPEMVRFMTERAAGHDNDERGPDTLEALLQLDTTRKAIKLAPAALQKLTTKAEELETARSNMASGMKELLDRVEEMMRRSEVAHASEVDALAHDIDALARKIETDHATALELGQADLPQVSRMAKTHTEQYIPSLRKRVKEMDGMVRYATQARNTAAADAVRLMAQVAAITSLQTAVKTQVTALATESNDDHATFDYLRLIQQVPYLYASFVAEAVRRREWSEKMRADSSTLANEMAIFQDEEAKRRKKWHRMVGSVYGPSEVAGGGGVVGLEVNLLGEEDDGKHTWPIMARKDLEVFIDALRHVNAHAGVVEDVQKLLVDLQSPTKRQLKRIRAFKNGSMHEGSGGLGRSGLLVRGDDDLVRSLQDDKTKLEDRLKTAESRVRRLEDLLHREQAARPVVGGITGLVQQQRQQQQLLVQNLSHKASSSSLARGSEGHRRSEGPRSEGGPDVAQLHRRIEELETQLAAEKERAAVFEQDLDARTNQHDTIKGQMEEVTSIKKDLLGNMEALEREWTMERKSLEDEIKLLKSRLEEADDEMETIGESRENERTVYDGRLHDLERHIERLGQVHADELTRVHDASKRQALDAQQEIERITSSLETAEKTADIQLRTLRELHLQVAPSETVPDELGDLIESLASRTTDAVARLQAADREMRDIDEERGRIAELDWKVDKYEGDIKDFENEMQYAAEREKELRREAKVAEDEISRLQQQVSASEDELVRLTAELVAATDNVKALTEEAKVSANKISTLEGEAKVASEKAMEAADKIAALEEGVRTAVDKAKSLEEDARVTAYRITSLEEDIRVAADRAKGLEYDSQVSSSEPITSLGEDSQVSSDDYKDTLVKRLVHRTERANDLTRRLYSQNDRLFRLLDRLGFSVARTGPETMSIQRLPKAERAQQQPLADSIRQSIMLGRGLAESAGLDALNWTSDDNADEATRYTSFLTSLGAFDTDAFTEAMYKRIKEIEHTARKMQRDARTHRDRAGIIQKEAAEKIAFRHFKEGDLALFLPTRNQQSAAWAAFNVGFPHYFLREQDAHRLHSREWIVARITRIQERVVELGDGMSAGSTVDENPFQLSDGLRWYLIDAHEDRPGAAPTTPGPGMSTVASTYVEATALPTLPPVEPKTTIPPPPPPPPAEPSRTSIHSIENIGKTLSKSLESRRSSSSASRRALNLPALFGKAPATPALASVATAKADASDAGSVSGVAIGGAREDGDGAGDGGGSVRGLSARGALARAVEGQAETGSISTPTSTRTRGESMDRTVAQRKSVVWDRLWSLDFRLEERKG